MSAFAPLPLRGGAKLLCGATEITCEATTQRNWSRVARGRRPDGSPVFLKQFLDRRGTWQVDHYRYERDGGTRARRVLGDLARVPELVHPSRPNLTLVYEHVAVETVDELLRRRPDVLGDRFPGLAERLRVIVDLLAEPSRRLTVGLTAKERPWGGPSRAVCFKGLDVRNLGYDAGGGLVAFDFGRPYLAPVEEAAAKLFVSIGLLRWGRPLRLFRCGPDDALLERAAAALGPYLDRDAVLAEVELQRSLRTGTFQGGRVSSVVKRWGVEILGRRYLDELESGCAALAA